LNEFAAIATGTASFDPSEAFFLVWSTVPLISKSHWGEKFPSFLRHRVLWFIDAVPNGFDSRQAAGLDRSRAAKKIR
jgi:hypothetical protein